MPELQLRGGEVDGLRLHYVVEGRGPAVIFVHGLGGFAESWRHNVRPLAGRATVFAVDLPGFGDSAKPRTRYRLGYFANALRGFMDALGLAQASLVGHSLGGAVSITLFGVSVSVASARESSATSTSFGNCETRTSGVAWWTTSFGS